MHWSLEYSIMLNSIVVKTKLLLDEEVVEAGSFPSTLDDGDWQMLGSGVGVTVRVHVVHGCQTLGSVGVFAHPQKEFPSGVQQKDVRVVQSGLGDLGGWFAPANLDRLSLGHLGDLSFSLAGQTEQTRDKLCHLTVVLFGRTHVSHVSGDGVPETGGLLPAVVDTLIQDHHGAFCRHALGKSVGTVAFLCVGLKQTNENKTQKTLVRQCQQTHPCGLKRTGLDSLLLRSTKTRWSCQ